MKQTPSLLSRIQAHLGETGELRADALKMVIDLALGRIQADQEMRIEIVSRFQAYEHEFWTAAKVELELISNGRTETRFDGGVPKTATITPENDLGAASAIRGASRVPSSEGHQPHLSPGGPPPANLPAAGEVF